MYAQTQLNLSPHHRGFHLISADIERAITKLPKINCGLLHIFIQHTSASLTINENADATVREDFESHFNQMVPENAPYYKHTLEGPDDMPAHLKSSILGSSVTVPVTDGRLNLGTWQGIYLCEHRDHGSPRTLVLTLHGE
ncbi:secondary thiamine-phosphate synthase enzyme YjbQ [Idiomarina seosinensis]|uniref:Secondary thiamine-phosphate synthase n=1 Tax=Idiomarina seosinensis TaxID=281739 RepID=A0A432Z6Z6_9GAMM|nr:secondary thiamine-phosphate synthase enzyme YjbQ [Idiomarina seosinensis]RUO73661.1 hypothetical protein CWI81_11600 [Idiomarina seosinensis]